jgi:hypothetical protein
MLTAASLSGFYPKLKIACAAGTAKLLWENQAEEMARGQKRGLQNFAEAEASGNEVGQKAGSPCF